MGWSSKYPPFLPCWSWHLSFLFFFTQQNATLQKIQRISSSNKKQGEEKHLLSKSDHRVIQKKWREKKLKKKGMSNAWSGQVKIPTPQKSKERIFFHSNQVFFVIENLQGFFEDLHRRCGLMLIFSTWCLTKLHFSMYHSNFSRKWAPTLDKFRNPAEKKPPGMVFDTLWIMEYLAYQLAALLDFWTINSIHQLPPILEARQSSHQWWCHGRWRLKDPVLAVLQLLQGGPNKPVEKMGGL